MERGKNSGGLTTLSPMITRLQVMASVANRLNLSAQLGFQYDGVRDIYQSLGYKKNPTVLDYFGLFFRHDMAQAVINRPVKATWQGVVEIWESDDDQETPLERAWTEMNDRLGLKARFSRVDTLSSLGQYGVLMLGLNDVQTDEQFAEEASPGTSRQLLYLKPFSERSATISQYEQDVTNPRYGQPFMYNIDIPDVFGGGSKTLRVHHSRIIHIVVDPLESEIIGTPQLEVIYNRLMDLDKVVGGDAEMYWRGARPGYNASVKEGFTLTADDEAALKDEIDEYEHNMRRILMSKGVDYNALETQISDPKNHVDILIQAISAVKCIPKRILMGSERGELASGQDADEWKTFIKSRREEHAETRIVRPFVDRCIQLGVLPKSREKYTVKWEDLFAVSEAQRVEFGVKRAEALSKYVSSPVSEAVLTPEAFLRLCMGLTDEQIELVGKMLQAAAGKERVLTPEEEEAVEENSKTVKETEPTVKRGVQKVKTT